MPFVNKIPFGIDPENFGRTTKIDVFEFSKPFRPYLKAPYW